jgi:NADPH2:quinone reductase
VEEVDLAEPGPQEVIMDVAFSGVNPVDLYAAQGRVAPDAPVPRTLGTEGAGMADGRRVVARGHGIGTVGQRGGRAAGRARRRPGRG